MKKLEELASKYIKKTSDNIYYIDGYEEDEESIKKAIIEAKSILASKPIAFSLDDFVLVRITSEKNYPRNFKYFALDERNAYVPIENPFYSLIGYLRYGVNDYYRDLEVGCPHEEINYEAYNIIAPRYRDTKHFSINSLASNIYQMFGYKVEFDKGKSVIIIEPLKERINDPKLVNLNPVDTFFDLKDSSLDISKNAVMVIQEDFLKDSQDQEFKEKLQNYPVFIYKTNSALAVDLVLAFLGYIPQRSVQQSKLKPECFFVNHQEISDKEFIRQYQEYIEYLNQTYLHTTYLQVPEYYQKNRRSHARDFIGLPGVLHSETAYAHAEQERNIESDINVYKEYISYMFSHIGVSSNILTDYLKLVEDDVMDIGSLPIKRTFFESFRKYENVIRDMVVKLTYPKYNELTEEFNQRQLSKIDKSRQG